MSVLDRRGSAVVASVWTLLQGVAFLVIAALGIMVHQCDVHMNKNRFEYFFYVIYFTSASCTKSLDLSLLDESLIGLNVTIDSSPLPAVRTYDWMMAYLVLTALWMLTAFMLLFGALRNISGKCLFFSTWPWVVVGVLTVCMDVAAAVTYALDIPKTTTFEEMFKFIGVVVPPEANLGALEASVTWIPSAIMVAFFSRFVLFWLLNVLLLVFVVYEAKSFNKRSKRSSRSRAVHRLPPTRPHRPRPTNGRDGYVDGWLSANPRYPVEVPRSYPNSLMSDDNMRQRNSHDSPYRDNHYSASHGSAPAMAVKPALRNPRSQSAHSEGDEVMVVSKLRSQFENRISSQAEELRGQLPWSYFQERSSAGVARQPGPPEDTELAMPPMPVPDYTLHFPKRPRDSDADRVMIGGQTARNSTNLKNNNNNYQSNKQDYSSR